MMSIKFMKRDSIQIHAHIILGFLIIQYLIGMYANLFVQFPQNANEKTLWKFAGQQVPVSLHMVLALLLIIGGIVLLVRAVMRKDRKWIIAAGLGLFSILVAAVAGVLFVPSQQNIYSYIMGIAFLLAFVSYGWGLFKARNNKN